MPFWGDFKYSDPQRGQKSGGNRPSAYVFPHLPQKLIKTKITYTFVGFIA